VKNRGQSINVMIAPHFSKQKRQCLQISLQKLSLTRL